MNRADAKLSTTLKLPSQSLPHPEALAQLARALSYAGWEDDVCYAEETFRRNQNIESELECIRFKQHLQDGDRSRPHVRQLDALGKTLSYPGSPLPHILWWKVSSIGL